MIVGWQTLEVLAGAGDEQAKCALLALAGPVGVRVRANRLGEIVIYRPLVAVLVAVGTRVRTTKAPVWAVRGDASGDTYEAEVPIGSRGTVVEIEPGVSRETLWVVRWDDTALGDSLLNALHEVCEIIP